MCFRRTLGAVERVEKEFLGVSHSESLCEHFPLNCVTNSALDRAPKCWHGHAEMFLLQLSSCSPHPCCSCLRLAKPLRGCQRTTPLLLTQGPCHPQACHMLLGPEKVLCLELRNTHSRKSPLSNFHGANQLGVFFSKFSAHLPVPCPQKGAEGWAFKMWLLYSGLFPPNHVILKNIRGCSFSNNIVLGPNVEAHSNGC